MQLILLDRDGVINYDSEDFIKSPEEWIPIAGSLEAIAQLNRAGYRVIVASNQSGLARGLFSIDHLNRIHDKMHRQLNELGGAIEAVFFCPHSATANCACRKPKPGMFQDIAARLGVSLKGVPAVGDSLRDLQAAAAVGATPILVRTGKGQSTEKELETSELKQVKIYDSLAVFVNFFLYKK